MHFRSVGALAGVLLLSTACAKASTSTETAPAPAAAAAAPAPARAVVNPVGRWTVALTAQGQAFDMVMELRAIQGDEFGGVINSQAFPPIPINKATRTGNSMVIKITAPTGDEATININFEGDTFTGDWSMPGDGSRVSGRRIQ
jgi:hypothetical protein